MPVRVIIADGYVATAVIQPRLCPRYTPHLGALLNLLTLKLREYRKQTNHCLAER